MNRMPFWTLLLVVTAISTVFGTFANCGRADESRKSTERSLIVVVGASGTPQYEISFYQWSERWTAAANSAQISSNVIGRHRGEFGDTMTDFQRFRNAVKQCEGESDNEVWIVLIGHGTFDRRTAKFNLRGPDVSVDELAEWLQPVKRPTAIINCSSASGPFLTRLAGPRRVVITATKSGTEIDFTRFGDSLSQAIADENADLDKDHQVSLWEAFLMASRKTTEFYDTEGRIATEHALLDDNGDRRGVRADQFRGLVPIVNPKEGAPLDGRYAQQWHLILNQSEARIPLEIRSRRNQLELAIEELRDRKASLPIDDYLAELEKRLVQLGELNEQFE